MAAQYAPILCMDNAPLPTSSKCNSQMLAMLPWASTCMHYVIRACAQDVCGACGRGRKCVCVCVRSSAGSMGSAAEAAGVSTAEAASASISVAEAAGVSAAETASASMHLRGRSRDLATH